MHLTRLPLNFTHTCIQSKMEPVYRVFLPFSLLVLAFLSFSEAKVIRGAVSSLQAWRERGQFVSKFCFHGTLNY